MHRSISLRTYFSIFLGILMIAMSGILSIIIGNKSVNNMKIEIGVSLEDTAIQMADKMDSFMWSRSGEIFTLSKLEALHNFENPKSIQQLLESLRENFPSFSWIGLTNKEGTVIASTDNILSGADISERPVYLEGMKGKFIGDVHDAVLLAKLLSNPTGEAMKFVDVSLPITDAKGEINGVLAAHLSWAWASEIKESVIDPLKEENNIEMLVVSAQDNTILLGSKDLIGQTYNQPGLKQVKKDINNWTIETWENGKQYLTGYAVADGYMNYQGLGWTIVVYQPVEQAFSSADELQLFIILVGTLCAIAFGIIIWFVAGKISTPIKAISSSAVELRQGYQTQIPLYSGIKELELLSVSLRELVNSLIKKESALNTMDTIAHHDFLTGLPNRIGLERYLEVATENASQNQKPLIILCLDLDGFKNVNDSFGHHVGDIILQEAANILNRYASEGDIVARMGGDEFVIILQARPNLNVERDITNPIIRALNAPFIVEGQTIHIGCSIGGAFWNPTMNLQDLLKHADEALYSSKRSGKNRATFYNYLK